MESIQEILARLSEQGVDFVVIGGVAAVLHGSARVTLDVDVCATLDERTFPKFWLRLGHQPTLAEHLTRPPLENDPGKLRGFHHLYLETDLGILDVLSEVTGVGDFQSVRDHSVVIEVGELKLRVLDLDTLIEAKRHLRRAAARNIGSIPELELIRAKLRERGQT